MGSAKGRATRQAVLSATNQNSRFTAMALEAITTVGTEWRAFLELSFGWRLWWLLTGRIHVKRSLVAPSAPADVGPETALKEEIGGE